MRRQIRIIFLFLAFGAVLVAVAFCVQEGSFPEAARTGIPLLLSTVIPEIKEVLGDIQETVAPGNSPEGDVTIQGTPFSKQTLIPTTTPTEIPPRNGLILFMGLDGGIYALDPESGSSVGLGKSADFHIYPGTRWYTQDGRTVVALRTVSDVNEIHLVPTNGTGPTVPLGRYTEGAELSSPSRPIEFSNDDRFVLMAEAGEGTATIHVVYLESGAKYDLTVDANEDSLQIASFLGNYGRIVVLGKDVENNDAFLGIYALRAEGLVEENRLAAFPGMVVKQFSISPDGFWIAIILADTAGAQSLYLLDVQNSAARELLPAENQEMLITESAWTEDGKWFVINRWYGGNELRYDFLAYPTQSGQATMIFAGEQATSAGSPVSYISDFSPDQQALSITLFNPSLKTTSNWMAVLGSDYKRKITESIETSSVAQGEAVTDVDALWIKMLVYASDPGLPTGKLYSSSLDGSNRILLGEFLPYPYYKIGPVISPDGMKAAFFHLSNPSIETEFGQLSVINLDGSGKKDLLQGNPGENMMVGIPLIWLEAIP